MKPNKNEEGPKKESMNPNKLKGPRKMKTPKLYKK
jgi:hypothetical protein